MPVNVRQVYTLALCAHMCWFYDVFTHWKELGGQHRASWELSTGLVNSCHSVICHPPFTIPISQTPSAKQRQRQPLQLQLHPKGPSLHEYLTSATASFCITHVPLHCSLSLSLSLCPPSSSPLLHQSISGYFVSQLYRELLLMTTITVVYFLSTAQPLYARRASITLWYSSALY